MARDNIPGLGHLLVGQPEISQGLARALNVKGETPQYLEKDFNLGITAEDLTQPEFRWLRRMTQWQSGIAISGVAAQRGFSALAPLATSQPRTVLTIIDKFIVGNNGGAVIGVLAGFASIDAGNPITASIANFLDDRQRNPGLTGQGFNQHISYNAAASVAIDRPVQLVVAANDNVTVTGPWISTFKDNLGFYVTTSTVNAPMLVTMFWRERPLLPSEL